MLIKTALRLGLADLSLKAVAMELGVTTHALYHYVRSINALRDLVAENLMRSLPDLPDDREDWALWIRRYAYNLKHLFETAPGLADHAISLSMETPSSARLFARSVLIAVRSGFAPLNALWATVAVAQLTAHFVSREQHRQAGNQGFGTSDIEVHERVIGQIEKVAPEHGEFFRSLPVFSRDIRFDFYLKSMIAGLVLYKDEPIDMQPDRSPPGPDVSDRLG